MLLTLQENRLHLSNGVPVGTVVLRIVRRHTRGSHGEAVDPLSVGGLAVAFKGLVVAGAVRG